MVTLSAFADEISADLGEQLAVLKQHNIKYMELRSVWNKNVKDFTDSEVETIKQALKEAGIGVSAIGSPLGKIGINDDFEQHLADLRRIIEIAKQLEAPYIRIFSFYIPEGEKAEDYREKVLDRMRTMVAVAKMEAPEIKLLHETKRYLRRHCRTMPGSYGEHQKTISLPSSIRRTSCRSAKAL